MSRTIKNERTRGFLDKLQKSRQTRKQVRAQKQQALEFDITDLYNSSNLDAEIVM